MYLKSLYLHQFRNYREDFFEFNPAVNLIHGPNAQGKTTLLEAIHYLMIGRSFRSSRRQDLTLTDADSFLLEAHFNKYSIDQKLRIYSDREERKIIHNTTQVSGAFGLLGLIQGVIMTPDDVNLIKGSPLPRRQFIDLYIAQGDPLYVHHLTRYIKAMRHRNRLLKIKKTASIELWEGEMAHAAAYITIQRRQTIDTLLQPCRNFYSRLTEEKENLNFVYQSSAASCESEREIKMFFLEKFAKHRSRELILGHTLSGPHKDDFRIEIGNREARFFASEGQQRSLVIALYMGAWKQLKQKTIHSPILMIDDFGIGLDRTRRIKLAEELETLGQVFLTSTDVGLRDSFSGPITVFKLPRSDH